MSEYVCEFGVPGNGLPVLHERITRCEACEYYQYSSGELPNQCFLFDYPTGLHCFCSSGRPREEASDFCSQGIPRRGGTDGDAAVARVTGGGASGAAHRVADMGGVVR